MTNVQSVSLGLEVRARGQNGCGSEPGKSFEKNCGPFCGPKNDQKPCKHAQIFFHMMFTFFPTNPIAFHLIFGAKSVSVCIKY